MKIRTGFVSNSSSSNFIVIFPRAPTSAEDLHQLLFGDEHLIVDAYGEDICSHVFVRNIWEDIETQSADPERCSAKIDEELKSIETYVDYYNDVKNDYGKQQSKYYNEILVNVRQTRKANKGHKIYIFNYANDGRYIFNYANDGRLGFLERGEQFEHPKRKVKAFHISHH